MQNDDEELKELINEYIKSLPDRIKGLVNKWEKLKQEWHTQDATELIHELHNLQGSAGTYGFNEITQIGKSVEAKLNQLMLNPKDIQLMSEIDDSINQLQLVPIEGNNSRHLK